MMNITIPQATLKQMLATAAQCSSTRSPIPILACMLLQARTDGTLAITATDLEAGLEIARPCNVHAPGAIALNGQLLGKLVAQLPHGDVQVTVDERTLQATFTSGGATVEMKGLAPDDYPKIYPGGSEHTHAATLRAATLQAIAKQVAIAAATDDTRPVLAAVLLRLSQEHGIVAAAADGFRLARLPLAEKAALDADVLLPARVLGILAAAGVDLSMSIGDGNGTVLFQAEPEGGSLLIVSRTISGNFPDFERVIPADYDTRVVVKTKDLAQALTLAQTVAAMQAVRLDTDEAGSISIAANTAETGSATSQVAATVTSASGVPVAVACNVGFFLRAVQAAGTDEVALELRNARTPVVVRPVGGGEYIHLIMPMTIQGQPV